jgi:hypothetical protein
LRSWWCEHIDDNDHDEDYDDDGMYITILTNLEAFLVIEVHVLVCESARVKAFKVLLSSIREYLVAADH